MSHAELPDPEKYYQALPLELQSEAPRLTIAQIATELTDEDPHIMPALGAIARHVGNSSFSKVEGVVEAFRLGRQYEQARQMDHHFSSSDIPEPIVPLSTENEPRAETA